jgi:PadR family transcriptional regulator, regulatory protein PadR
MVMTAVIAAQHHAAAPSASSRGALPALDCRPRTWYYRIMISADDTILRDFFLGFVKIHILHHAAQEPVYGLALIEELRRHSYALSPGTLYPLLHSMEAAGYLVRAERVVSGKVRKYYTATEAGQAALDEARQKIRELVVEVLEGHGPSRMPTQADAREEGAVQL